MIKALKLANQLYMRLRVRAVKRGGGALSNFIITEKKTSKLPD